MEIRFYTRVFICCFVGVLVLAAFAPAAEVMSLWQDETPGALGEAEKDIPTLTPFIPSPEIATGTAVVICPGGGYSGLATGHEGRQIGQWLQDIGVTAFMLKYRLPKKGYPHPVPLFDAQRAIRTVRFNADKWNLQPDKIGILGFSAGGHLASSAGTHFNNPVTLDGYQTDDIDAVSCKPNFMVLVYPVISMQPEITHWGSRNNLLGRDPSDELVKLMSNELQVTEKTPPTFLIHASDDKAVVPENSIRFYQALLEAKVPAEMHMFLKGGHGFGTRESAGRTSKWTDLCEGWMRQMELLRPQSATAFKESTKNLNWKFDFGSERAADGYIAVTPETGYSAQKGFGFLLGADVTAVKRDGNDALTNDFCTSDKPFLFSVDVLEEGNYRVTLTLGGTDAKAITTVKAESRRLMLQDVETAAGTTQTRTIIVNVRTPKLPDGKSVKTNGREEGALHWDKSLTLEFNGTSPSVCSIEISKADDVPTIFLAGDSTVTDQTNEPWTSWGQMLTRFFGPEVAIANHAESGRALYSFRWEKRLEKVLSMIRPEDYLFVQFGHNDQKNKREGAGPFTTYKKDLEDYIAKVRAKGAKPVLISPMERRRWNGGKPGQTLTDFAKAVQMVGKEQNVPVIDLHAMSLKLYAALGEKESKRAFVHYPANTFPGQNSELSDNTHHNAYGAYVLARCIVEGVRKQVPELTKYLRADAGSFDPCRPDAPDLLEIPASPVYSKQKPEGN